MEKIGFKLKILFIPCEENDYRPKFLAGNILFNIVLGLLILKIIAVGFIIYTPNSLFFADLTKLSLIAMTNQERVISGVGTLTENSKLDEAAMQKAQDMFANGYFAHESPQGISPWYWFRQLGYNYKTAGENLAIGFLDSEEVLKAWENSPSHRENLLNPKFRETGIAVATGDFQGSKATVVVQLFGTTLSAITPVSSSVAAKTPTSTLTPKKETPVKINPTDNATVVVPTQKNDLVSVAAVQGETNTTQENLVNNSEAQETNNGFMQKFLQFMIFTYPNILQKVIFYTLLIITAALILNIFIKIKHQDKKLIAKTAAFIILLILFVLSDRGLIIQLIPHNLLI